MTDLESIPEDQIFEFKEDPEQNIPPALLRRLERFALRIKNYETASSRIDAVDFLMREWLMDDGAVEPWIEDNRNKNYVIAQNSAGDWEHVSTEDLSFLETATLPASLVDFLIKRILDEEELVRKEYALSVLMLMGDWKAYLYDEEKLLGHLIIKHSARVRNDERDLDSMIDLHRALHAS